MTQKPIKVEILEREYTLRVNPEDEADTREIAALVDDKMQSFRQAHPNQVELTTAIVTALALAEELHTARAEKDRLRNDTNQALSELSRSLQEAITDEASGSFDEQRFTSSN